MMNIEVIIVGGGLSGLYAAMLLEKAGINYLLLEGRERMGGRILQANTVEADLGATWFWPTIQPALKQLLSHSVIRRGGTCFLSVPKMPLLAILDLSLRLPPPV
ncbi:NAD(P)-binding protein [Klebsiella pneumoniae]|uniref:NAD(P)-binding protein n=1 Tax=Klebsiella pneumoniae TaxID=573 RepID=UPI000E2B17DE|nr:NAD(P)-binding protein [Klebsiella pneumoniae]SYK26022.1 ribulose-1,5-biphosphate synthetase [Klebsiella pneumoniae]